MRGWETILLAEDEDAVRVPAKLVLEENGYNPLCAGNGREAIEIFKVHADKIKLVILDLVMPKLSGREAWRQINKLRPGVKTIFTSGYKASESAPAGTVVLAKPFPLKQLVYQVRALLDQ